MGVIQKKKLIDSVFRGYPIPLIYFHHIRQSAGKLVAERFEIIDGQQRINALAEYCDGAFKLCSDRRVAIHKTGHRCYARYQRSVNR